VSGSVGYLLKKTPPARLRESLGEAVAGGAPMSPEVGRRVVALFRSFRPPDSANCDLTQHEIRLLRLFVEGHNYKTAAAELGVRFTPSAFTSAASIRNSRSIRNPTRSRKRFAIGSSDFPRVRRFSCSGLNQRKGHEGRRGWRLRPLRPLRSFGGKAATHLRKRFGRASDAFTEMDSAASWSAGSSRAAEASGPSRCRPAVSAVPLARPCLRLPTPGHPPARPRRSDRRRE
jgi:hypothetical protein